MAATLIRLPEVIQRTGLSRSAVYELIKASHFPHQIKLGVRAVAWNSSAVDAWINERIAEAEQGGKAA